MTTTTVYDATTWSVQDFYDDPRRPALLDWLNANDIDPADLPLEQAITIHDTDHGREIRYVVQQRTEEGRVRAVNGSPVFEARTAPCTVRPPAELTKEN